jgi:hypothetical protein
VIIHDRNKITLIATTKESILKAVKKSMPNQLTTFKEFLGINHPFLKCVSYEDAPLGFKIKIPLFKCTADPHNSNSCILANVMDDLRLGIFNETRDTLGVPMLGGISIIMNTALVAFQIDATSYRVVRFKHNGNRFIRAIDSQDPVKIEAMWKAISKNAKMTLSRFQPTVTIEGRAIREAERKEERRLQREKEEQDKLNGIVKEKEEEKAPITGRGIRTRKPYTPSERNIVTGRKNEEARLLVANGI